MSIQEPIFFCAFHASTAKTRAMHGEQVLQAIKEIKNIEESKPVSISISMSLFPVESKREFVTVS